MTISSFCTDILLGVIGNVVFAFLTVWLVQKYRYWKILKSKFHNRTFETFYKRYPNEVVQIVKCKVVGNRLLFEGKKVGDTNHFKGEFVMNEINLTIGEGYHSHINSDAFGFMKIIIKDENTFFVEAPYIAVKENEFKNKESVVIKQAFIWKKKSVH